MFASLTRERVSLQWTAARPIGSAWGKEVATGSERKPKKHATLRVKRIRYAGHMQVLRHAGG